MAIQRGNFISGGQVTNAVYQEGGHLTDFDQIDQVIGLLQETKEVLQSESKQKKKKFLERFQKEGLRFFSDTLSATIAALLAKAIG